MYHACSTLWPCPYKLGTNARTTFSQSRLSPPDWHYWFAPVRAALVFGLFPDCPRSFGSAKRVGVIHRTQFPLLLFRARWAQFASWLANEQSHPARPHSEPEQRLL